MIPEGEELLHAGLWLVVLFDWVLAGLVAAR